MSTSPFPWCDQCASWHAPDQHFPSSPGTSDLSGRLRAANAEIHLLQSRLDAALARDAMIANHDCSHDGCAVPDGYTKEGAAFAQKYHDLKAERDSLASRLGAHQSLFWRLLAWADRESITVRVDGWNASQAISLMTELHAIVGEARSLLEGVVERGATK